MIYNKYGMLDQKYFTELGNAEKEAFAVFKKYFGEQNLPDSRCLFNEFLSSLQCRFSEFILTEAMNMKKEERINNHD